MRIKICGITKPDQGRAIAELGATALGFICVSRSPRYVKPEQIGAVVQQLPSEVDRIGVFANATVKEIVETVTATDLSGVQLHGDETPIYCQQLRQRLPDTELIKAIRVKSPQTLAQLDAYYEWIDTFLLDAYHPQQLGGTGKTLDWEALRQTCLARPWLLAGGLTPDNVTNALTQLQPHGIDLSSGVERSPGDKDLEKVALLFTQLKAALLRSNGKNTAYG
ncbi:MAG: phosphoribosylanthranilate isomerase [Cyanophyceae cyanobacterium]